MSSTASEISNTTFTLGAFDGLEGIEGIDIGHPQHTYSHQYAQQPYHHPHSHQQNHQHPQQHFSSQGQGQGRGEGVSVGGGSVLNPLEGGFVEGLGATRGHRERGASTEVVTGAGMGAYAGGSVGARGALTEEALAKLNEATATAGPIAGVGEPDVREGEGPGDLDDEVLDALRKQFPHIAFVVREV